MTYIQAGADLAQRTAQQGEVEVRTRGTQEGAAVRRPHAGERGYVWQVREVVN